MKSEKVAHMHQGIITFIDDDHIRSVWHLHTDGKTTYTADHKLVRRRNK